MTEAKRERCERCGWPLYSSMEQGCTRDNCSERPLPPIRPLTAPAKPDIYAVIAEVMEGLIREPFKEPDVDNERHWSWNKECPIWNNAIKAFAEKLIAALKDKGA